MKQIIFTFFLIASGAITICACSIAPEIRGVDRHLRDFRQAKAVFIGRVIGVSIDDSPITKPSRTDVFYKVKFSVEKSWKGQSSEITVISDNGESICGRFSFQVGKKYLIYAETFEDKLTVWAVGGSPSEPIDLENLGVRKRLKQLNSFWFRRKANK